MSERNEGPKNEQKNNPLAGVVSLAIICSTIVTVVWIIWH